MEIINNEKQLTGVEGRVTPEGIRQGAAMEIYVTIMKRVSFEGTPEKAFVGGREIPVTNLQTAIAANAQSFTSTARAVHSELVNSHH